MLKCSSCSKQIPQVPKNYGANVTDLPLPIPFCYTPAWICPYCGRVIEMDNTNSTKMQRLSAQMKYLRDYRKMEMEESKWTSTK